MTRPTSTLVLHAALLTTSLVVFGCDPIPLELPLPGHRVDLDLKVAPAGALQGVGALEVSFLVDGEDGGSGVLVVSEGQASWRDEPPEVALGGELVVDVTARTLIDDSPFDPPLRGRSDPINLDALQPGAPVSVPVVLSSAGAVALHAASLPGPRRQHRAAALFDGRVLVVGGYDGGDDVTPSWASASLVFDAVGNAHCQSDVGETGCAFGAVPPARVDHVMVRLADGFDPSCPGYDQILVGLGRDDDGARGDLFVFDPGGLDGDGAFRATEAVRPRFRATAVPTRDCRVLFIGGEDADGEVLAVEALTFGDGGESVTSDAGALPEGASNTQSVRLENVPDEVVVFGGVNRDGDVTTGWIVGGRDDPVVFCDLADASCNGSVAGPPCARAAPSVGAIPGAGDLAAFLVVGDGLADDCNEPALLRAALEAKAGFYALTLAGAPPAERPRGAIIVPAGDGAVLVLGGYAADGTPTTLVERYDIDLEANEGDTTAVITAQPVLPGPLVETAAARVGDATLLLGGGDGSGSPSDEVLVIVRER